MNFTMLDNRLIDDGIIGDLTGAELKVYLSYPKSGKVLKKQANKA